MYLLLAPFSLYNNATLIDAFFFLIVVPICRGYTIFGSAIQCCRENVDLVEELEDLC